MEAGKLPVILIFLRNVCLSKETFILAKFASRYGDCIVYYLLVAESALSFIKRDNASDHNHSSVNDLTE